jgi:hypothetical protein
MSSSSNSKISTEMNIKEKAAEILVQLLCGSIGGGVSTFFTYPMANIRLRNIVG